MSTLLHFCIALVAVILMLILVVGLHELGHAVAARLFHIKIKKIAIGFGKPIMQWTGKNGCEWVWATWPLGGSVQLLNTRNEPVAPEYYSECFDKKPIWKRIVVLLSGSITNLITAWLVLVLLFLIGLNYRLPIIQSVQPSSVAAASGFLVGDQLVSFNERITPSWPDVGMQLVSLWGKKEVKVTVKRPNNEIHELNLNLSQISLKKTDKSLLASIGLTPNLTAPKATMRYPNLLDAIYHTNNTIMNMLSFFLMTMKQLIFGIIPFSLLIGPVGLFAASIASLTQGVVVYMYFIVNLSVAVALVNLLPVPGLDGGSIVYAMIEKIRAKPVSVALEILLQRFALIAICLLFVQLVLNDLQRIYS